mmetsp:Transcript_14627/g.28821  ORF Transcript_14627/g.28821 Transcript_14627/m.28821 type:complete len:166 (+) Transcript_14627:97-594(+)
MPSIVLQTALGDITLTLRPDVAPTTCEYISKLVASKAYDGCCFYRSDFVIQMGLTTVDGKKVKNPQARLTVNEAKLSNVRGAVAIAHWDCVRSCGTGCRSHDPDCGGSEFFINLKANVHLDTTWGGYCVFATVADQKSLGVVDAIAKAKKQDKKNILIKKAILVD